MLPAFAHGSPVRHYVSKRALSEPPKGDSYEALRARMLAQNQMLADLTSVFELNGLPFGSPIVTYCGRKMPWRPDGPLEARECRTCLWSIAEPYRNEGRRGTA